MSDSRAAAPLSLECGAQLGRCSTADDVFAILALDHQDSLKRALQPAAPGRVTAGDLGCFKREVAAALAHRASGILLDAPSGIPAVLPDGCARQAGLLVAIERSDYDLRPAPKALEIEPGLSVARIAGLGAAGVKLFLYDDPADVEISAQQDQLIRQIADECRARHLPLYAEPIVVANEASDNFTERVIQAALRQQGLGATILKLEFPLNHRQYPAEADWRAACRELSSVLNIPWVLLSAGVDFPTFARQLEIACRAGASGFMVGRALWGEACQFECGSRRRKWLREVAEGRLEMLRAIARVYARPWREFYAVPPTPSEWYWQQ